MEVWVDEGRRPEVMSTTNVGLAVALHVLLVLAFFYAARIHFKPKETVIPIDLTVVVNENLDGVDDEPPPLDDPPPPPPTSPKVVTPPPPPPPTPPVGAVVKTPDKPKPPEKPKETLEDRLKKMRDSVKAPEPKPPEVKPPAPEPPKKTKEELLKERMENMVKNAKTVKIKVPDAPSGNGRTERQMRTPEDVRKLLDQGYKPGTRTQLATSMMQFCISRIQSAIDARWSAVNPPIGAEGTVFISVRFDATGRMVNCRLDRSCGDRTSDTAALTVVRTVGPIAGLDREFIRKYMKEDLTIRYKVVAR